MYKILVIGQQATGKTSLVNRFVNKTFDTAHRPTIACDFSLKIIQINGRPLRIQLWDIAGQDRLQGITKLFCRGASAAFVVADITRQETLQNAKNWKKKVDQQLMDEQNKSVPMVLACNKYDLVSDQNKLEQFMQEDFLKSFAEENGFVSVFYTSAKKDLNVNQMVFALVNEVVKIQHQGSVSMGGRKLRNSVALNRKKMQEKQKQQKSGCCK